MVTLARGGGGGGGATFSAVLVQIWAVFDSGAVSRLCSRAITSAAMLLATWPLMNGLTGSDLGDVTTETQQGLRDGER